MPGTCIYPWNSVDKKIDFLSTLTFNSDHVFKTTLCQIWHETRTQDRLSDRILRQHWSKMWSKNRNWRSNLTFASNFISNSTTILCQKSDRFCGLTFVSFVSKGKLPEGAGKYLLAKQHKIVPYSVNSFALIPSRNSIKFIHLKRNIHCTFSSLMELLHLLNELSSTYFQIWNNGISSFRCISPNVMYFYLLP